ncbi:MAG: MBL fold metallo-hydrolase [Hyphomicrobiaceae bacterium]|nr:MBL fold metallo-hydrolase [Hyphomicrobiaceae bacterium]
MKRQPQYAACVPRKDPVTVDTISRRHVLLGSGVLAGAAVAGVLPQFGPAAQLAHAAGATTHALKLGDFEITIVSDGHLVTPTRLEAPDVPEAERKAALTAAGQTAEMAQRPTNVTVIKTGEELIVVDAGSGPNFMPTAGKLTANLEAAGFDIEKVTKVIFTHGHPDHLWGALDDFEEGLRFPNATYMMAEGEWDYWMSENAEKGLPADRVTFVAAARRNIAGIEKKAQRFKTGQDIIPGLRAFDTPGHTQGHVSFELAGGGDSLVILGDALLHPIISFQHPEWRVGADHVVDQAVETRKKLLDRLAADKPRIIGFHLPFPGLGRVEKKDNGYIYVAAG